MQWHSMFFALSSNPKKANIMQLWSSFSHKRFGNSIPLSECHIYLKHSEKCGWIGEVCVMAAVWYPGFWPVQLVKLPWDFGFSHHFEKWWFTPFGWYINHVLKKCGGWTSRKLSFVLKLNWDFNFNPSFLTNFFSGRGFDIADVSPLWCWKLETASLAHPQKIILLEERDWSQRGIEPAIELYSLALATKYHLSSGKQEIHESPTPETSRR